MFLMILKLNLFVCLLLKYPSQKRLHHGKVQPFFLLPDTISNQDFASMLEHHPWHFE
jgi:hypothetical protein